MKPEPLLVDHRQAGYALLVVTVLAFVIGITGMSLFMIASQETRQALYRQDSAEAFFLADGAVERARAKLLADMSWREGWDGESAGRGTYDLSMADTSFAGHDQAVRMIAAGHVEGAERRVEVLADIPATGWGLTMLIMGDAYVDGTMCLDGDVHVNGEGDFGPDGVHLGCGGVLTDEFVITPPPIFTQPDSFPDATYYFVRGDRRGGVDHARIFDREGNDRTTELGDSLTDVISYRPATQTFVYAFDNNQHWIDHYFDQATGVFRRLGSDRSVVVNFGEPPLNAPDGIADLEFKGASTHVNSTIINTRFRAGAPDSERVHTEFWTGGLTTVKQVVWEPYYGIGLVAHNFEKQGGALVQFGTEQWPALLYVTQDVVELTSNFELVGCVICLRDWHSSGNPQLIFDDDFLDNGPEFFEHEWDWGVSGTLEVIRWREIAREGT